MALPIPLPFKKGTRFTYKALALAVLIILQFFFFNYLYHFFISIVHHNNSNDSGRAIEVLQIDEESTTNKHHLLLKHITHSKDPELRCPAYFNQLFQLDPSFNTLGGVIGTKNTNDPTDDGRTNQGKEYPLLKLKYEPNLDSVSSHQYYEQKLNQLKQKYKAENKDINDINTKELLEQVNKQLIQNKIYKNNMIDSISSLRWFFDCTSALSGSSEIDECTTLESSLFPWFTFQIPVFERWDHTVLKEKFPHVQVFDSHDSKIQLHAHHDHLDGSSKQCFWENFESNYSDKGIVIPMTSQDDFKKVIKLIQIFRSLGNTLPIELVYNSMFYKPSDKDIEELISVGRKIVEIGKSTGRSGTNNIKLKEFKQELWFVDIANSVDSSLPLDIIRKISKTLLPTIFSSFEEVLFISSDSIPMKAELFSIFETSEAYKETGLFLFKSRQDVAGTKEQGQGRNFKKLIESLLPTEFEQKVMSNHKATTTQSPGQRQGEGKGESRKSTVIKKYLNKSNSNRITDPRVFVINKSNHLKGLLLSLQLSITSDIHSDELIWLGEYLLSNTAAPEELLAISYNELQPGNIGSVWNDKLGQPTVSSKQSGHFIGTSLMWISDGFKICEGADVKKDFERLKKTGEGESGNSNTPEFLNANKIQNEEELKRKYNELISLSAAIIPLEVISPLSTTTPTEQQQQKADSSTNNWIQTGYCSNGIYIAKNSLLLEKQLTENAKEIEFQPGKIFKFSGEVVDRYMKLQKIWASNEYQISSVEIIDPDATQGQAEAEGIGEEAASPKA